MSFILYLLITLTKVCYSKNLPNILILIADDLGYGDIGPFGNKTIPTPNLDNLALRGLKFTHHLTAASLCTPSRAAFLTGRYPIRYGLASPWLSRVFIFVASNGGLPQTETTFAKKLKQKNYKTALIGKWHLGNYCSSKADACHNPTKHGFDYFYGTTLTDLKDFGEDGSSVILSFFPPFNYVLTTVFIGFVLILVFTNYFSFKKFKYPQVFKWTLMIISLIGIYSTIFLLLFQQNITKLNSILMRNEQVIEQPIVMKTLTERIVNESIKFIDKQLQENNNFLLMTSFLKVHTAHFPSDRFLGKSKHGKFGDSVMEMDWAIGEIVNHLNKLRIRDNTFIYFSSDNGAHLEEYNINNEYEGGYNGNLPGGKGGGAIEGGIRVPAIISWTNDKNVQNEETNIPTSQMDLFPTLAEIVNDTESLNNLDGESFLDLLSKPKTLINKNRFFIHYCGTYIHGARYIENEEHVFKIYYYKPKFISDTESKCKFVCRCYGDYVKKIEPPEIYNVAIDAEEKIPLNRTTDLYNNLINKFSIAISKHKKTINQNVECQMSFWNIIWKPHLQPCCNFPFCTCKEEI